jgi:hypothetical protein
MWAKYDYSKFPIVNVSFNSNIKDEEEFKLFLKEWLELYKKQKDFTFVFDTTNVGLINISYCFKLKKFIGELKQLPKQYLQKSIIIVSNKYIKHLLNIIFKITKPIAKVYIYEINSKDDDKDKDIDKEINIEKNINIEKYNMNDTNLEREINNFLSDKLLNLIEVNKTDDFKIITP